MSQCMIKPTKWPLHPVKTQLGIHPVWSEPSLPTWRKFGSWAIHKAHSKDSDPSLRCVHIWYHWFCHAVAHMSQLMRLWCLSLRWPVKAQASLRIYADMLEASLFADTKYGSRRKVRPKIRHPVPMCMCVWRMSLWRTKSAIISWDGSWFYGELIKMILKLSSNTQLIYFSVKVKNLHFPSL